MLRLWRIGRLAQTRDWPVVPSLVRLACRALFQSDVPLTLDLPDGVVFMHNGLGTVVHPDVRFNGPALVFQHTTLGNSKGVSDGSPTIGSYVMVGAGAVVMGSVSIGDGSVIGANAVVTRDVPALHVAYGNPAKLKPADVEQVRRVFPGCRLPEPETATKTRGRAA